ncbi:hypothetical protein [Salipiger mucosus]|uniref:Lysozyme inhibitor LprI N-terminal domain-containing protein n=1 Tax=Salipiger mucosus DSM 16094 TaxID=1123237 RepID=S9RXH1_9RHOB|nr:hypothetical protein [Salipiger mucosus]EPX78679.1 hypothetical protein Salmuc_04261 [Salipiger mucosus DSM 16094]
MRFTAFATALGLVAGALPATAQSIEIDGTRVAECLSGEAAQAEPGQCITEAHAGCLGLSPDEAPQAATLCFVEAKQQWGALVSERMKALGEEVAPEALTRLQINARYDLLSDMLQCERVEALAKAGEASAEQITLGRARCEATATGFLFARLTRAGGDSAEIETSDDSGADE